MGSRHDAIQRSTSAGYRLPDRATAQQLASTSSVSISKSIPGAQPIPQASAKEKEKRCWKDTVRHDQVWREFVEAERRGGKRWEIRKKWKSYQKKCLFFLTKYPTPQTRLLGVG
ncbi:hypothetical protein XENTR_v10014963 [Xenopus tropicalis]|nr:hypothetical protein XENTR_v10014963 [Xenopus tropicalis]